jgi:hypothetical protein
MTARPANPDVAAALAEALKVQATSLGSSMLVEIPPARRNDRGWPTYIVAARLDGAEFTGDEVGTWAVGEAPDWGPIFALNETARAYSPWGEAAQPGSRADGIMRMLAEYPEAAEAGTAVRSAGR